MRDIVMFTDHEKLSDRQFTEVLALLVFWRPQYTRAHCEPTSVIEPNSTLVAFLNLTPASGAAKWRQPPCVTPECPLDCAHWHVLVPKAPLANNP